jgi:hypothetical protein
MAGHVLEGANGVCRVMVCGLSRSNKVNPAGLPKKINLHNVINAACGNSMDITVN